MLIVLIHIDKGEIYPALVSPAHRPACGITTNRLESGSYPTQQLVTVSTHWPFAAAGRARHSHFVLLSSVIPTKQLH